MKASNFRKGNLIDTINRGGEVHLPNNYPMVVYEISTFEILAHKPEDNPASLRHMPVIGLQDVSGLDLTEERLLNFGFKKVGINYERDWLLLWTNKTTGSIDFVLHEGHSNKRKTTQLTHVHQLQNLFFALTGEELQSN